MLKFLFAGLTPAQPRAAALFSALTAIARNPHFYVAGEVPDTIDGRFAMLASVTALAMVRLEGFGEQGDLASVALTERFVAVMESEHRELGLGDPGLGKTVRSLVALLAKRVDIWREATAGTRSFDDAARASCPAAGDAGIPHLARAFQLLWAKLQTRDGDDLLRGTVE